MRSLSATLHNIATNYKVEVKKASTLTNSTISSYTKFVGVFVDYCDANNIDITETCAIDEFLTFRLQSETTPKLQLERRAIGYLYQMAGYTEETNPARITTILHLRKKPKTPKKAPQPVAPKLSRPSPNERNAKRRKENQSDEETLDIETVAPMEVEDIEPASLVPAKDNSLRLVRASTTDSAISSMSALEIEKIFNETFVDKRDDLLEATNYLVNHDSQLAMDFYKKYQGTEIEWATEDEKILYLVINVFSLMCQTDNTHVTEFYQQFLKDYAWKSAWKGNNHFICIFEIFQRLLIECNGELLDSFYNKFLKSFDFESKLDYKTGTKLEIFNGFLKKDCVDFAMTFFNENLK